MTISYPATRTDSKGWAFIPTNTPTQDFVQKVSLSETLSRSEYIEVAVHALIRECDSTTILLSGGFND